MIHILFLKTVAPPKLKKKENKDSFYQDLKKKQNCCSSLDILLVYFHFINVLLNFKIELQKIELQF